ncbi:MAG: hypothetical protein E6J91_32555 [Deltaproteobacteria bacterium]|nr:MAG: hypothetical protein E6J91_32555 [Deltaproteobacteria bacterium]
MMADEEEPREAALEIDEIEEVEEAPAIPPPRSSLTFRTPVPTPPPLPATRPPVVTVPPRNASVKTPPLGSTRPPLVPRPTASTPPGLSVTAPPVSIPPREAEPPRLDARAEPAAEPGEPGTLSEAAQALADTGLMVGGGTGAAPALPREPAAEPDTTSDGEARAQEPPAAGPDAITTTGERRRTGPTLPSLGESFEGMIGSSPDIATLVAGGVEVSTEVANIVVDKPLEAHLESPTVLDRALDELGDVYERRLAYEARAAKAYRRALGLDPALRANLWAIRRVFYRRALWPNLVKLIDAEVGYARDDHERADLLLEKARICAEHMNDAGEARAALLEATQIAPQHQAALLELERLVARGGDVGKLLDVWELLAEAVEHPARKIAYWLEVARAAAQTEHGRAQAAFDQAASLAQGAPELAEAHGAPGDVTAAIDALVAQLTAVLGGTDAAAAAAEPERAQRIRRELVALRRRQAQLARGESAERAWDVLQQAIALLPGEPLVLSDLTELAEELGRYDALAELVQSWQAVEGDPGRAMVLSIRRADALLRGGQREEARSLLASLEASAPGFIVLTSAAERDALARGDAGDLARTYLAAAQAALLGTWLGPGQQPVPDPAAAAALYVQAAELLAYEVGGAEALDEARGALGKALEAVPDHPVALEALTELDDTTGNLAEALARLKTQAAAVEGDARRALVERAIRLARSHGELDAVLQLETELVELAPSDLALRWRLEATLAQLGRDDDRAQLLTELAGLEPDAMRRGTALLAAARLRERGGAVEQATELYRQVLALWPEDTFARESLIDLLRAQEKWTELVTERRTEARALPDGAAARRALREAAWVLEVRLGDTASAAQVYDEWLGRLPEDRTALEGAARCRASFGDRLGEVTARRAIADIDPSPESQWLLGRALERSGQFDDAADVFRALALHDDASVAATSAALALADLASARADTVMRVEATASLAGRTTEPRLGAALAEDSGWMYALVLEDFERAQQSFAAATTLEPSRRGALIGAALIAARRLDAPALSAAYDGLAASVEMPEAAAALHLRAAAMAAATGDLDLANQRVAAARTAAPDDVSALLVLAETGAIPVIESAADNAGAIDALLARAEVLELRAALADDPASRASWELDRAEALELGGRLREAGAVVAAVLASQPSDLRALEALRRMALRAGDRPAWAHASYELAKVLGDPTAKLGLLRDTASVIDPRDPETRGPDQALAGPDPRRRHHPDRPARRPAGVARVRDRGRQRRREADGAAPARARHAAARPGRSHRGDGRSRRAARPRREQRRGAAVPRGPRDARRRHRLRGRAVAALPVGRDPPAAPRRDRAPARAGAGREQRPRRRDREPRAGRGGLAGRWPAARAPARPVHARQRLGPRDPRAPRARPAAADRPGQGARGAPAGPDAARSAQRPRRCPARPRSRPHARPAQPRRRARARRAARAGRAPAGAVGRRGEPAGLDRPEPAQRRALRAARPGDRVAERRRRAVARAGRRRGARHAVARSAPGARAGPRQARGAAAGPARRGGARDAARRLARRAGRAVAGDRAGGPGGDRRRRRQARLHPRRPDRGQEARRSLRAARRRTGVLQRRRRRDLHQRRAQRHGAGARRGHPDPVPGRRRRRRGPAAAALAARPRGRHARRGSRAAVGAARG